MFVNIQIPELNGSESMAEHDRMIVEFLGNLLREINIVLAGIGDENINFRDISGLIAAVKAGGGEV